MNNETKHVTVSWIWKTLLILIIMFAIYGVGSLLKQSYNQPSIKIVTDSVYVTIDSSKKK